MDKCFCHLNGYAVKDATARNEIANIKETYATKEELNNIDIPEVDLEPYATKEYVDGAIPKVTTLFYNSAGTTDTITLSDTISNYDYIEIYFQDATKYRAFSKTEAIPGRVYLNTQNIHKSESKENCNSTLIEFNENTVTFVAGYTIIHYQGNATFSDYKLSITKIVGIKY